MWWRSAQVGDPLNEGLQWWAGIVRCGTMKSSAEPLSAHTCHMTIRPPCRCPFACSFTPCACREPGPDPPGREHLQPGVALRLRWADGHA